MNERTRVPPGERRGRRALPTGTFRRYFSYFLSKRNLRWRQKRRLGRNGASEIQHGFLRRRGALNRACTRATHIYARRLDEREDPPSYASRSGASRRVEMNSSRPCVRTVADRRDHPTNLASRAPAQRDLSPPRSESAVRPSSDGAAVTSGRAASPAERARAPARRDGSAHVVGE